MRYGYLLLLLLNMVYAIEVGKVDEFRGKVDKLEKGQVRPQALAKENLRLSVGDVIRTKSDGAAKVSFIDGNRLELGPLTKLSITDYQQVKSINVARGRVLFDVEKLRPGEGFEIRTPTAILGVKGTRFLIDVAPTSTVVVVFSGAVQISPINNPSVSSIATPGGIYEVTNTNVNTQTPRTEPSTRIAPSMEPLRPPVQEVTPPCVR